MAPLTSAVARIPAPVGTRVCDRAGRYWLVVERESKKGSDAARWPLELVYGVKAPLKKGVTPAASEPEYGVDGKSAALPSGDPRDVRGGAGFNNAKELGRGVWRDRILPSQTLWYKVPAGWGGRCATTSSSPTSRPWSRPPRRTRTGRRSCSHRPASRSAVAASSPRRTAMDNGRPAAIRMGSVPVAWTNRYEYRSTVQPVHTRGEFYISVTLGARAAEIAENPQIGVVLRVSVLGDERAGPEHGAAVLAKKTDNRADKKGNSTAAADSDGTGGAGWTGIAAAAGAGAVVVVIAGLVFVRSRRRVATQTTRGSA